MGIKSSAPEKSSTATVPPSVSSTIRSILQITIDPSEPPTKGIVFLSNLAEEVIEESDSTELTTDLLDHIFWARLTEIPGADKNAFNYLVNVYERCNSTKTPVSSEISDVKKKISERAADFAVICATSDLTEAGHNTINLAEYVLSHGTSSTFTTYEFIGLICKMAEDQDMLFEILNPLFNQLRDSMVKAGYTGDYRTHLLVLEQLLNIKLIASNIYMLDSFPITSESKAATITETTLLGPFLGISPLEGPGALMNFTEADSISAVNVTRISQSIDVEYRVIQDRLFQICNKLVRASPDMRIALLKYFGAVIDLNHKRTAMHVEPHTVSPDGFMLNITQILTKFCEPFCDFYGKKIDKIDPAYFSTGKAYYNIIEETKVSADLETSKEFYSKSRDSGEPNFITHVFFLTIAYYQYGLIGSFQSLQRVSQGVDQLSMNLNRLRVEMGRFAGSSRLPMVQNTIDKLKKQHTQTCAMKYSLEAVLRSPQLMTSFVEYSIFHLMVLVRFAEPAHKYPYDGKYSNLTLPFDPDYTADNFANFPEYYIEAPIAFLIDICRYIPQVLVSAPMTPLVVFAVVVLRNTKLIKNPYLKSQMAELLFYGAMENHGRSGFFVPIFDSEKIVLEHLFHGLMNFYIEVEQTGRSSQFYEKFKIRYYISQIIRVIWSNNSYRQKLVNESEVDVDFFVQFVALLLNDSTYLMDESLTKLTEIHKLQKELHGATVDDPATQEKRSHMAEAEKQAKSYLQLTNSTILLLRLFTSTVAKAFVTPEIVDRLAAMMDYNLAALVGPKCRELKVENPEKYGFRPRALVEDLVHVYANLKSEDSFIKAMARDGRSFDISNFERAKSILSKSGVSSKILSDFSDLANAADKVRLDDEQGDLELGDIPDEYLDPLMYTLMENPVTLPSSKVNIDLSTIKQHLLSDKNDPFNRSPLSIEDVIVNDELRNEIETWKAKKRQEARQAKSDQMEIDS